jgi:hypothetical protein
MAKIAGSGSIGQKKEKIIIFSSRIPVPENKSLLSKSVTGYGPLPTAESGSGPLNRIRKYEGKT